ncbi:MAG: ATPase, T2SS/T4P/T4SS family, partial [Polyangiales bacterium]
HEPVLTPSAAERVFAEVWGQDVMLELSIDGELRSIYDLPERGVRARTHGFVSELGLNMTLHVLERTVLAPAQLGLTAALHALRDARWGLCVCSGPTGAGKTTTLWSLAQALAAERAVHVVSLEQPIEMQLGGGLGLFDQREVGRHVASYAEGIRWAVAQAADVIVVGDLLAPGALSACLAALRTRCLVLAGVRASSSRKALASLLSQADHAERARIELAAGLRVLLHQRLVPRAKGPGRVAAIEQLINTAQAAQLIRDDQLQQLPALIAASKGAGMVSLDDALDELVRASSITRGSARHVARRSERWESP